MKYHSGSSGTMLTYTNSNIAIFLNTPPEMAGVTGAVFNSVRFISVLICFRVSHDDIALPLSCCFTHRLFNSE